MKRSPAFGGKSGSGPKKSLRDTGKRFVPLLAAEKSNVILAFAGIVISSITALVAPVMIIRAIDKYIRPRQGNGLIAAALLVFAVYLAGSVASYIQVRTMGGIGRRVLFSLRNQLFLKLHELPVAFFNQNKAGDLISRASITIPTNSTSSYRNP